MEPVGGDHGEPGTPRERCTREHFTGRAGHLIVNIQAIENTFRCCGRLFTINEKLRGAPNQSHRSRGELAMGPQLRHTARRKHVVSDEEDDEHDHAQGGEGEWSAN